jgi:hypothetical protein
MKQKDIALIIMLALVSAGISIFISSKLFVTPKDRQQKVEVIDPISTDMNQVDKRYFNEASINPTKNTQLDGTNQTLFNTTAR